MAKSPSFFGLRRGSTKSLTFQVLNGRQVTKDRVYDVKNPRTFSQMQQRMVMATAAAAYAGMREIVDHSFEGITYGQPTMSEFIRLNAKMLRQSITDGTCIYNPYKERGALPNPYIVSKGTLDRKFTFGDIDIDGSLITFYIQYNGVDLEQTTVRQFFDHIGLSLRGYITILCLAYSPETNVHQFGFVRLTPTGNELDTEMSGVGFFDVFDVESNVPVDIDSNAIKEYNTAIGIDFDEGAIMRVSLAVIISEKQQSWRRSSESMLIQTRNEYQLPTPAETLATYPVGTDYILNGGTI